MAEKQRTFRIQNDSHHRMAINVEPEAITCALNPSDEVLVTETYSDEPLTLVISAIEDSQIVLSLWPGDGHVIVEKDGRDILDTPQALKHLSGDPGR